MEGYLTKRKDHMNIYWRERYFMLEGSQLRYYKKRGDPTPRDTIVLSKGCVVGQVFNSEEKHRHHDAVWMFRITFAVDVGVKGNRKNRFIDLGAKSMAEAKMWTLALEAAVETLRNHAASRPSYEPSEYTEIKSQAVRKMLLVDDDSFSILDLSKDTQDSERGWWTAKLQDGLRVLQECPCGIEAAADEYRMIAIKSNQLFVCALVSSVIAFACASTVIQSLSVCFCISISAVVLCFLVFANGGRYCSDVPLYRVSQVVRGTPVDVFRLVINPDRWHLWDASIQQGRVVHTMDDHSDIIHMTLRPVFVWPFWHKARDVVLTRYWRREEDGSYFIMYQSSEHADYPETSKQVRGNILGSVFTIAPQKGAHAMPKSLVTHVVRYDPKGYSSLFKQLGYGVDLVMPFLRRVIGIRDELSQLHFIKPTVTVPVATDEVVDGKVKVDSDGMIQGVEKLSCNFPEEMWAEPIASKFMIRGTNYIMDRKKVPAGPSGFHLVGVDFFAFERNGDQYDIGSCDASSVKNIDEFTFIINMLIPGPENLCIAIYYQAAKPNGLDDHGPFSELLHEFMDGNNEFRNGRFKLIPTVAEGSFIIKQSVGSKPTLIGNKLQCPYYKGKNYFEVDVDIASNGVANTVVSMVRGVTKSLIVDIAFLIESQSEDELPETILGTIRLDHVSLDNPIHVPTRSDTPGSPLL